MKRTVHVAHIDRSTSPVTYSEPGTYRVNVLPSSSTATVEAYGPEYADVLFVVCDAKYGADIRELDLVYVFTEPPVPPIEEPVEPPVEPPVESQADESDGGEEPPSTEKPPEGVEPPAEEEPPEEEPWWDGLASDADFFVESKLPMIGSVKLVLRRREKSGGM